MKLEKIRIENFRGITSEELDFHDELGRVLDKVPIVGPNTSGKTSILDAITVCLGPVTRLPSMRSDLVLSPPSLVRRGAAQARVTCAVRFSDEEIAQTKEVFERVGHPHAVNIPKRNQVTIEWNYPDLAGRGLYGLGFTRTDPLEAHLLFEGRSVAGRSFHVPGVNTRSLRALGGVFMFDQKRTGLAQRVSAEMRAIAVANWGDAFAVSPDEPTTDPRLILLQLASRAQARQDPEATDHEDFERLRELYAHVCAPHRIKGLYTTGSSLDMEFEGPQGVYLFDGLSSGQLMLLLLLLQFARRRIHKSIVLIDELELHLHPLWQSRLYQSLRELGIGNQVFFTTHSTHLRDLLRGEFFHCTGDLGDETVKKHEA